MSKQVIYITSACQLSLENKQLVIEKENELIYRSIEDIRMLFIDHHSAHITIPLLNYLSDNKVGVVFCNETHIPTSMIMGLHSNSRMTMYIRGQMQMSEPTKKRIWKRIVEAKIYNQSLLLYKLGIVKDGLKPYYSNVKSGDSIKHRKRIEKIICDKSKVSVIFVGDKQNEYSYHHLSHKKNEGFLLNPPENVEFF